MKLRQINLLIKLKTYSVFRKEKIKFSFSYKSLKLIIFLYNEGLIQSFSNSSSDLIIFLRFFNNSSFFDELKIFPKSFSSSFLTYKQLLRVKSDKKILVFSTDKGLVNLLFCKKNHLGGQLLFTC